MRENKAALNITTFTVLGVVYSADCCGEYRQLCTFYLQKLVIAAGNTDSCVSLLLSVSVSLALCFTGFLYNFDAEYAPIGGQQSFSNTDFSL